MKNAHSPLACLSVAIALAFGASAAQAQQVTIKFSHFLASNSNFHKGLSSDYEKVRCIVNASDKATASRLADLVCAQVARAEIRNVEVVKEIRTNFKGQGFWVRVYAVG